MVTLMLDPSRTDPTQIFFNKQNLRLKPGFLHPGGRALPKSERSAIGLARERGRPAGKNPMVLVILAWVLGHFLPRKSDKPKVLNLSEFDIAMPRYLIAVPPSSPEAADT